MTIKRKVFRTTRYPFRKGKNRNFQEIMLERTESTLTEHFYPNIKKDINNISFSKITIQKVINIQEWGIHPNRAKYVQINEQRCLLNYWDYIDAFSQCFYYENPNKKYSWFIRINKGILNDALPMWFYQWWDHFGAFLDILPEKIRELYSPWVDTHPKFHDQESNMITDESVMYFFLEAEIPYIFKWEIKAELNEKQIPVLNRKFLVRWWNKIDENFKYEKIGLIIEKNKKILEKRVNNSLEEDSTINKLKKNFRIKYPALIPGYLILKSFFNLLMVESFNKSSWNL